MWMIRRIALAAGVVALLPIVLAVLALGLAWVFGCPVTEGGLRPCRAFGTDIGWLIGTLLVSVIPLAAMLIPPAIAVVVEWAVAEVINFLRTGST
jgi:hypothetical protein